VYAANERAMGGGEDERHPHDRTASLRRRAHRSRRDDAAARGTGSRVVPGSLAAEPTEGGPVTGIEPVRPPIDLLVERARNSDLEAFEEIVRMLQGPVRAFARRVMGDAAAGDDAAQETFLRVWKGLGSYRPSERFMAWVFTIARNTCIEMWRREQRTPVPVESLPEDRRHIDPTDGADLKRAVSEAVSRLPDTIRATFLLREAGLSYEEIAVAEGCPVGTVRSRLHSARRSLAASLEPFMFGGDA